MKEHRTPSYLSMICPVCGGNSVIPVPSSNARRSKFRCSACDVNLEVRLTFRVLWSFLAALLVPAGAFLLHWLLLHTDLPKIAIAAINGGYVGGGVTYTFGLIRKGMIFRPSNAA